MAFLILIIIVINELAVQKFLAEYEEGKSQACNGIITIIVAVRTAVVASLHHRVVEEWVNKAKGS